jgi:hypothetical protein
MSTKNYKELDELSVLEKDWWSVNKKGSTSLLEGDWIGRDCAVVKGLQ